MRRPGLCALLLAALSVPASAQQFFVEASRPAIVREDHDADARELLRLARGDRLNCVTPDQTESFYNVFLPDGQTGWVSRFVVRLHEGAAPAAPTQPIAAGVPNGMTAQEQEWAAFHLTDAGAPRGATQLVRPGYVVGYDPRLKIASWVQYRLTAERSQLDAFPRSDAFDEDPAVPAPARATLDDYAAASPGYVRGHMAPADDMRWDEQAELLSNLLTNMSPQIGSSFNGSVWKTLENRVRRWAEDRGEITIICGPVFSAAPAVSPIPRQPATQRQILYNVVGQGDVAVPTAYFKIVVDLEDRDHPNVLAFLMTHMETEPGPERDLATWLTSVDEIERVTGLDFLTALPESVQRDVEAAAATTVW